MTILDALRTKLSARRASPLTTYWARVRELAHETIPERKLDAAVAELGALIDLLGKSDDDLERDIELLRDLAAIDVQAAAAESAATAMRAAQDRAGADRARADALEAEAKRIRQAVEADLHRARAAVEAARVAKGERHRLLRELRDRGFPDATAEIDGRVERDLVADLRRQLADVEREIEELRARRATAGTPRGDNIEEDPAALDPAIDKLERRRGALQKCITERRAPRAEEFV